MELMLNRTGLTIPNPYFLIIKTINEKPVLTATLLLFLFSCKKEIESTQVKTTDVSTAIASGNRIYFTQPGNYINENFNYSPGDTSF
jgi:hypothetical protein